MTEHLQRVISECADKPPVESDVLAESLKQAMGDVAELQKELAECVNERNVTDVELDKLKASRDAGANGSAETEAERQMAEWAAEEEALAAQLAAERDEAEKLLKLLQEHEGQGGGESGAGCVSGSPSSKRRSSRRGRMCSGRKRRRRDGGAL